MSFTRLVSRPALAAVGLGLALSLAACGGGSSDSPKSAESAKAEAFAKQKGDKIVAAAVTAMKATKVSSLSGNMIQDGHRLDIDVQSDGKGGCAGKLTSQGGTASFVATDNATYLKGNDEFWVQNAGGEAQAQQTISFLKGRWAKLAHSDQFAELCNLGQQLFDTAGNAKKDDFTVGKTSKVNGHPVVELASVDGKEKYRMFVRTDEPHQLLKLVSDTVGDKGEIDFDFDKKVDIEIPPASESVTLG